MLRKMYALILLICIIGFLSSCSVKIVPTMQPVNPSRVQQININNPVSIENVQTSNELVPIFQYMDNSAPTDAATANLYDWSCHAVSLLKKELKKRDVEIINQASKILKLSISKAFIRNNKTLYLSCTLTLAVETGDGVSKSYTVINRSGGSAHRACGGAITLAITELLKDKEIIDYLANSKN